MNLEMESNNRNKTPNPQKVQLEIKFCSEDILCISMFSSAPVIEIKIKIKADQLTCPKTRNAG